MGIAAFAKFILARHYFSHYFMTQVDSVNSSEKEVPIAQDLSVEEDDSIDENNDVIRDYAEAEFDKQLMALASGALVLTIGFVKDIVTITAATHKRPLLISWVLFSLTLIVNLLSHLATVKAIDQRTLGKRLSSDTWNTCVKAMNYAAVGSFIAGIGFFIAFVFMNMDNKPATEQVTAIPIVKKQSLEVPKTPTLPTKSQVLTPVQNEKPIKAKTNKD